MDGRDGDDDVGVLVACGASMVDEDEVAWWLEFDQETDRDGMKKTDDMYTLVHVLICINSYQSSC